VTSELAVLVPAHVGDVHAYQWALLVLIVGGPFLVIGVLVRWRRAQALAAEPERDGDGDERPAGQPWERR
jgi:hypothetical protein